MIVLLRGIGIVLVIVGIGAIITGHGMVWYRDGFWAMADMLSPHNFVNTLAMLALLAPGFFFLWLSDRLARRRKRKPI